MGDHEAINRMIQHYRSLREWLPTAKRGALYGN